jgi:outer membrane lipoprotein SlyB
LEIIMKKLLAALILGSALSACASSGGYNDPYNNSGYNNGYNDDAYVEYQGQRYRKTPAYIECARRDRNSQLLGAGIGAVVGGVVGNEIDGGGTGAAVGAVGGAAAGVAIANKSCGKYLDTRYDDPRYDPYANSQGYTINGRTYYSEQDVEARIRYLESEDRRLANQPYSSNNRYQRDQIRDELEDLHDLDRRW